MLTSSVEVLWTARYDYQPFWMLETHEHEYYQIIYFLSGRGKFFLDAEEHAITRGDLFLIKPGQPHGLTASSHVKTLDIKFTVKDVRLEKSLGATTSLFLIEDAGIAMLFDRIRREGERRGPLYREMCGTYLLQLLILLLRQTRQGGSAEELAPPAEELCQQDLVSRKVLGVIREHYAEDLNIQQIAHLLGYTDRYLRKKFCEHVGLSPTHYLLNYRVEKAKELINKSDYALKEVAELVGFKSIHHFTRVFTELAGMSPGAWRKKFREGIRKDVCINPRFSNTILTSENLPPGQVSRTLRATSDLDKT